MAFGDSEKLPTSTRVTLGSRLNDIQLGKPFYGGVSSGSSNNYVMNFAPGAGPDIWSPVGQRYYFIADRANAGAPTIEIGGVTKSLYDLSGSLAVPAGAIQEEDLVEFFYDGTVCRLIGATAGVLNSRSSAAIWGGTAGGTADALEVTIPKIPAAIFAGFAVRFIVASNNTATGPQLVVKDSAASLDAKPMRRANGSTSLAIRELRAGALVECVYNGTAWCCHGIGSITETWTPSTTASGSMTFTSVTFSNCRFIVDTGRGKVLMRGQVTGTVGGTLSNTLTVSTPLTPRDPVHSFACAIADGGGSFSQPGCCYYSGTSSAIAIRKPGLANFASGTAVLLLTGEFEI